MHFELPMIDAGVSIEEACAETIESNKSGLLIQGEGEIRLLRFDRMVEAARGGRSLEEVEFEPVVDIEAVSDLEHETFVRAAGSVFGFLGKGDGLAHLFSVSEQFAFPYLTTSSASRCQRPDKPANTAAREWYHYYPPQGS